MADPSIQTQPTDAVPAAPGPDALAAAPPEAVAPRSALAIVFLVVFIDLLGFGIVLPLLPLYGESYVAALFAGGHESGAGGAVVGLLMASFSAMQFIFAPVWGRVSDRVGRRPILLIGLAGSVVFYTLFGYASDLPLTVAALALTLLFVARLGAGIAGATIATAQAVIADCTPPERRKHGMALIGAAFGIGFTFGPLVGFAALTWFPLYRGAIGYAAAALSFVALVLGVILLPETRRFGAAPPLDRKWFNWQGVRIALRNPAVAPVVLVFFLSTLGFGSFEVTLSLLNKDALHLSNNHNFLVFAYVGFVLMLTQGFLYRRLAKRLSEATFIAIGIVLMALGVGSLGAVSWLALSGPYDFRLLLGLLLASLTLAVVGFAFLTPSAQALISRRTDPGKQGEVLGVNQSAAALARILGPIFGLTLYGLTPTHLLPYAFGAALLLLMLPLLPRIRRG
ncbi:MAG TPA: MFS transporter [Gemmataceae bacterium]|nr:MFS transporter [Gemmataceae bacterium]